MHEWLSVVAVRMVAISKRHLQVEAASVRAWIANNLTKRTRVSTLTAAIDVTQIGEADVQFCLFPRDGNHDIQYDLSSVGVRVSFTIDHRDDVTWIGMPVPGGDE
jgi:hypothetical protein